MTVMTTLSSFRNELLKTKGPKGKFEVTNSYGIKDAYRWVKKTLWPRKQSPVSEHDFRIIINTINKHLQDRLVNSKDVTLPCHMGVLEVVKKPVKIEFIDGKLKTNLSVDWKKTIALWYEDKEAFDNRTIVRNETSELFNIAYRKIKAKYKNKAFFKFRPTRDVRLKLKNNINNGTIDAPLLKKRYGFYKY